MKKEIARDIATVRIKRAIEGYGDTPPLRGGFRFCNLSEHALFDANGQISEHVTFRDLAHHVFFTETGEPLPKASGKSPKLGVHQGRAIYLLYNGVLADKSPHGGNVLTVSVLDNLPLHDGPRVIYGNGCRIGPSRLRRAEITFKQLPYELKVE